MELRVIATTCRVLLVDDNEEFLRSAANFLSAEPDVEVIGRAKSGNEALLQVPLLRPDVVLMDWTMPGMSGLEATRQLKSQPDSPRIIVLTLHDIPEYRAAAAQALADGFVAKSELGVQLLPTIQRLWASAI